MFKEDSLCPVCGTTQLVKKVGGETFRFPIEKDAFLTIIVPDVESWNCSLCNDGFFQHGPEGWTKVLLAMKKAKEDWEKEKENLGF
jgi:hypothetical protein